MMFASLVYVFLIVASTAVSTTFKETPDSCSLTEFSCGDGGCVSSDLICDGTRDCADGSDEKCGIGSSQLSLFDPVLHRSRRQARRCSKVQWQCRDGSCISFDGKCDGVVDCADGSDETHALCRNSQCQYNWFRCTYGACVDGTAACNGKQECADNSDELLPKCRNETDEVRGQFKCRDGSFIPAANHCDGVRDCPDGSDETVRACAAKTCPSYLFQCAYGACVDSGADCNKITECADGSDEAVELCGGQGGVIPPPTTGSTSRPPSSSGDCVLPPYPDHGTYTTDVGGKPGQAYDFVSLTVTCRKGYGVRDKNSSICYTGIWHNPIPECLPMCELKKNPSIEYRCLVPNIQGSRICNRFEHNGTIVIPECVAPNYYSPTTLTYMTCIDGSWDHQATCIPECGRVTPDGEQLVIGGRLAKRGELPWHAGIYSKQTNPYMQICGGSLISRNMVISAAHCFWNDVEKATPAQRYAVAVGKLYRPYNNKMEDAQKSDVKEIHIPTRFQGSQANFQEDIAVVITVLSFEYKTYVRPVCVDFSYNFNRQQLSSGMTGKVAGWGLTAENGNASQVLKVIDLPYIDVTECIATAQPGFREYITSDKICAGYKNAGSALCKGDSGGGLVFPGSDRGIERYYLRGIVSTAPNNENLCNANTFTAFTEVFKHEQFIRTFWTGPL